MGHGNTRGAKNHWEYKRCQSSKPLTKLAIASYNAKTLRTEDRMEELLYELDKINWDVVGLSEVRRPGEEYLKLANGHSLYYRGSDSDKHEHGVALLINKRISGNIISINSVSDRILYLILHITKKVTLKVIQVYAPTSTAPDAEVEQMYEDISSCMKGHKTTYTMITGDLNAKIGVKEDDSEHVLGKFGYGSRNARGHTLINFLEQEKLFHMSSFFQKRPERKWTWLSPGARYKNEIDYVFSSHKCIVKDVSVLNSFNTGSDHRLIRALVQINTKLERYASIRRKRTKVDPECLLMNRESYQKEVENNLKLINTDTSDVNDLLNHLSSSLCKAAKYIAVRKTSRPNKLQPKTRELLEQRRTLIKQGESHTTLFKIVCKEARACLESDIEVYREKVVKNIIEKHRGPKVFKKALKPGTQQITKLCDTEGNIVTEQKRLLELVEEYYQLLYSSKNPEPFGLSDRKITNVGSEDVPEITTTEIRAALHRMSNGKAPGEDDIIIEMVKEGGDEVVEIIEKLFNKCLEESRIPEKWESAIVILLFKKGNKADLNNYRPISLLSQLYKLFTKIITIRLTNKLDFYQPVEQAGFRSGYSTMDHILTMRIVIEKATEYQMPLWLAFIDYKKAFDSIESWAVIQSLQNARIDHRYTNLVNNIYQKATLKVNLPPETKPVAIRRGVRQGDTLSPKLFTLVLEDIFKTLHWEGCGINIEGKRLSNLRFADDIVLFSDNPTDLEAMIQELNNASVRCGLEMNLDKTKIMTNCFNTTSIIKVNDTVIERVTKYVYLGQEVVMGKDNQANEIDRRIRLAWAAYSKLEFAFRMNFTAVQKARIYDQCILPVLTYGAETWVFTKEILQKLQVAQRAVERKLVGVTLRDRKRNQWLRQQSKVTDVIKHVAKLKWQWAGHIARKQGSWCKAVIEWRPWGEKRPQGRPQMRWYDDIKRTAGTKWIETAQDRKRWQKMKEAYTLGVEYG